MIPFPDLGPVMPEILLTCLALLVLLLDLVLRRKETVAAVSIVVAIIVAYSLIGSSGVTFDGMFISDGYSQFFKVIFLVSLVLSILISINYIKVEKSNHGEYYALMLFATLGMMIMASAGNLIVLYLGLELMALSTYILAGFMKHDRKSNEAAIKYLLLGAFSSAFLLYGISIVYGLTGTTDIRGISDFIVANGLSGNSALILSITFFCAAFAFKIAAVPFHMWAPDVYEGAPTAVTAFMSVGPKAAGFAAIGRVFLIAFGSEFVDWSAILIPIAVLTMGFGNIVALSQTNIKRMLAYSSIAHAGYALIGVIAGGTDGVGSMMNYLLIYSFMNIGAFGVVILLRRDGFEGTNINDYKGLAKSNPLSAALMLIFMFSLTGIPPTAGFIGKVYIFMAAISAGYTWLVITAVVFSAISAFFYLRIVIFMYMSEQEGEDVVLSTSPGINFALALSAIGVIALGVMPAKVLALAKLAAKGFLG
jgi:NADH-quinone oxidoreductase subunit N